MVWSICIGAGVINERRCFSWRLADDDSTWFVRRRVGFFTAGRLFSSPRWSLKWNYSNSFYRTRNKTSVVRSFPAVIFNNLNRTVHDVLILLKWHAIELTIGSVVLFRGSTFQTADSNNRPNQRIKRKSTWAKCRRLAWVQSQWRPCR